MSSEEELNYSDEEESEESGSEIENELDTESVDSDNSTAFDLAAAHHWHEVRLENLPPTPLAFHFMVHRALKWFLTQMFFSNI